MGCKLKINKLITLITCIDDKTSNDSQLLQGTIQKYNSESTLYFLYYGCELLELLSLIQAI